MEQSLERVLFPACSSSCLETHISSAEGARSSVMGDAVRWSSCGPLE